MRGVVAEDSETGKSLRVAARVVVNATGPFSDQILQLDDPTRDNRSSRPARASILYSIASFCRANRRCIVPEDARRPRDLRRSLARSRGYRHHRHAAADMPLEPRPLPGEVDFLLETIAPYLARKPQRADIRSIFAGIRPLVRGGDASKTSKLGRDHEVRVSPQPGSFRCWAANGRHTARWPKTASTRPLASPV